MSSSDEGVYVNGVLADSVSWHFANGVDKLVAAALKRMNEGTDVEAIQESLRRQERQLWIVYDEGEMIGCAITQIVIYPRVKRLLYYIIAGRDFKKWIGLRSKVESWARSQGCTQKEIYGRKGWTKVLSKIGYKVDYVVMSAPL